MQGEASAWNFLAWNRNGNGEPIRCIGDGFRTACSEDVMGRKEVERRWDKQRKKKRE
jgi:hypothetical protein